MSETRLSLLDSARAGSASAWSELDRIYRPFVLRWFTAQGLPPADAEDLAQEVLTAVFRGLPDFSHPGRPGAFRGWLRQMCLHRALNYRRAQVYRGRPVGGTDFQQQLNEVAEGRDEEAAWDREHDRHVLRRLFERVRGEFADSTLAAFERLAFAGATAEAVARELGLSVGAVHVARSRVLRRLRELAAGMIDEAYFG